MAIANTLNPDDFNLAFGHNLFGFNGLTTEDKYVIRIKEGTTVLADLRQGPNLEGDAIFDVQNVLQSYVQPSAYYAERLGQHEVTPFVNTPLLNSANEVFQYNLTYGYELAGAVTELSTLADFRAFGGAKPYYDTEWKWTTYQPEVEGDDSVDACTVVTRTGAILTDYDNLQVVGDLGGGYPTRMLSSGSRVQHYKKTRNQHLTLSYFNDLERAAPPNPPANTKVRTIEMFTVSVYDGNTLISTLNVPNIIRNGGGPNVDIGNGLVATGDTTAITFGCGPMNLNGMRYYQASTGGISFFNLPSNATHYYVSTHAWTPSGCTTEEPNITDIPLHYVARVDIVDDNCLDYTPLEVSWQNSFGFRDYYLFNKRQEQSISVNRNNFLKSNINYGGLSDDAGANYGDRGYTTYSQKIQEQYVANTGYMEDSTAMYLRNLYQSPDVRVRLTNKYTESTYDELFYPVNLLTSSWAEKNYKKDKLFQYEMRFKLANNIKSMRG